MHTRSRVLHAGARHRFIHRLSTLSVHSNKLRPRPDTFRAASHQPHGFIDDDGKSSKEAAVNFQKIVKKTCARPLRLTAEEVRVLGVRQREKQRAIEIQSIRTEAWCPFNNQIGRINSHNDDSLGIHIFNYLHCRNTPGTFARAIHRL
jgi:hypothetical protein